MTWNKSSDNLISLQTRNILSSQHLSICAEREWGRFWDSDLQTKRSPHWQKQHRFLKAKLQFLLSRSHFVGSVFVLIWPPGGVSYILFLALGFFLSISLHVSECFSQMTSRTSQGTKPLFFPLATLMKPLCSPSLLTQIWQKKRNVEIKRLLLFCVFLLSRYCAGSSPQFKWRETAERPFLFKHDSPHTLFSGFGVEQFDFPELNPIQYHYDKLEHWLQPELISQHQCQTSYRHSCSWTLLNLWD